MNIYGHGFFANCIDTCMQVGRREMKWRGLCEHRNVLLVSVYLVIKSIRVVRLLYLQLAYGCLMDFLWMFADCLTDAGCWRVASMPTTIALETASSSNTGKLHTHDLNLAKQMELCFVEQICNTQNKNWMFVRGNTYYRLDSIKAYSKSAGHRRRIAKDTTVEVNTTPAQQILLRLNKLIVQRMKHLFWNCHAIGKKDRPYLHVYY